MGKVTRSVLLGGLCETLHDVQTMNSIITIKKIFFVCVSVSNIYIYIYRKVLGLGRLQWKCG